LKHGQDETFAENADRVVDWLYRRNRVNIRAYVLRRVWRGWAVACARPYNGAHHAANIAAPTAEAAATITLNHYR